MLESGVSLVAQTVKNSPVKQEAQVQFLGWEDPLEEGMGAHSSILAWRIPMDKEAWWGCIELEMNERLSTVGGENVSHSVHV